MTVHRSGSKFAACDSVAQRAGVLAAAALMNLAMCT